MKEKWTQKVLRKFAAGVLVAIMILTGTCLFDAKAGTVHAEDAVSDATTEAIYVNVSDISAYRGNGYTYPKPTIEGKEDWVFAGWYKEDTNAEDGYTAYREAVMSGVTGAYAKYVSPEVLSAKFQVSAGTNEASETADLRIVSTVDGANYKKVGFVLTSLRTGTTKTTTSTTVYKRIKSATDGLEYGYSPVIFDTEAEYFTTVTIANIKNENFDKGYVVTPYWETLDGTTVQGVTRSAKVSDSYNQIANIPVRLYSDATASAGPITVDYNADAFTYIESEAGTLSVDVAVETGEAGKLTVTIPDGTSLAKPDGMLVNLRFNILDEAQSNEKFEMSGVTGVCDAWYRTFSSYYTGTPDTSWYDEFSDESKFVIATADDLYGFAKILNATEGTYQTENFDNNEIILGADITVNKGKATENGWEKESESDTLHNWIALGEDGTSEFKNYVRFRGIFDGDGHTISGIYMDKVKDNDADYYGLFGITHKESTLHNFRLVNSYFKIDACEITDTVKDQNAMLGSVVGEPIGPVDTVYSEAIVISNGKYVGGLFGRTYSGDTAANDTSNNYFQKIDNCEFAGTVKVTRQTLAGLEFCVGGIAGGAVQGVTKISNCHMSGIVQTTYNEGDNIGNSISVGGIMGNIGGTVFLTMENCLVTGDIEVYDANTEVIDGKVSQVNQAGAYALLGYNNWNGSMCTIKDCYATQESNMRERLFGNRNDFDVVYIMGDEENTTYVDYPSSAEGKATYYNFSVPGTHTEANFTGYENRANLGLLGIYTKNEDDETNHWVITESGVPRLKSFCDEWLDFGWYDEHKTDSADTFTIKTAEELYAFSLVSQADSFKDDTVELGDDIKMNTGVASYWAEGTVTPKRHFVPIGKGGEFAGTFDGNGYEVNGVYVCETATAGNGFFAIVTAPAIITDFKLINSCIVIENVANNGAIVGNSQGSSLSNIYTDAIVKITTNHNCTGGIVGMANNGKADTTISNCWFAGEVETNGSFAGGIVGYVNQKTVTIENCLNTGKVNSTAKDSTAGGIVGAIKNKTTKATIKNSLNTGTVTAPAEKCVGSVVGEIIKPTVFENVYTTVVNDGETIVGIGNSTLETTITGEPAHITTLSGKDAYVYTELDFESVWGAVEGGTPVIKDLYDGTVMSGLNGQRYSMDWYYNKAYYTNESLSNSIKKFTVENVADFYGLSKIVNDGHTFRGQTVELVKDDDFDLNPDYTVTVNKEDSTVTTSGSKNKWTPIGSSDSNCFDGTFDGNMNTITGLYLDTTSNRGGLFGTTGANATIKNFTIDNSYYKTTKQYLAAVSSYASGDFENIYIAENVWLESTYQTSSTDVNAFVAGIAAHYRGTGEKKIAGCWFDGHITTYGRYVGGIVGQLYEGTKHIENCLVTGNIVGTSNKATFTGGIVGSIIGASTDSPVAYLTNCVAAGTVKNTKASESLQAIGSVVGRSITGTNATNLIRVKVYVENVYTTDELQVDSGITTGNDINGFGNASYRYAYIYGEPMIVTAADISGVAGYINTKLSYETASEDGIWVATDEGPRLAPFATANVTDFGNAQRASISFMYNDFVYNQDKATKNKAVDQQSTTFMIEDLSDMYGFASIVNEQKTINGATELFAGKTVKLANDIIFNNVTTGKEAAGWAADPSTAPTSSWVPIGTVNDDKSAGYAFQGTFDGDGYAIKGLYVASDEEFLGLFRKIQDATICNLDLVNSYIVCTDDIGSQSTIMGSIAGGGDGTLENVYSDAIVKGQRYVGGLIGYISHTNKTDTKMKLNSCWFDGVIDVDYKGSSRANIGGLVGLPYHGETVFDTCLYTGTIDFAVDYTGTGTAYGPQIGGICGGDGGNYASLSYVVTKNTISAGEIHSTVLTCEKNPGLTYIGSVYGDVRRADSSAENTYALTTMTDTKESTGATTTRTATHYESEKTTDPVVTIDATYMGAEDALYGYGAQMWTELSFTAEDRLTADDITLEEGQVASEVAGPIWAAIKGDIPVPATLAGDSALEIIVGKPDTELAGSGTEADPWKIATVEELAGFAKLSKTKTFKDEYVVLANDIIINEGEDASKWVDDTAEPTLPWNISIGYEGTSGSDGKRFEGTFDGMDPTTGKIHTISGICFENASKDKTNYVGLFAATEVGSTVKNLRLQNSYFEQVGTGRTGSIVGDCHGTVSNVYSNATVKTVADCAGGIVGRANGYDYASHKNGTESRIAQTIDNCWYDGHILLADKEGTYGGGIAGVLMQGEWTFNNCVFTGTITSDLDENKYACVGAMCGTVSAPDSTTTSTMDSKLTLNSCIGAGTIQFSNNGLGAGALVGRMRANIEFDETTTTDEVTGEEVTTTTWKHSGASHLVMNNVFTTREAGYQEVGSFDSVTEKDTEGTEYTATPTIEGEAVWTNSADRLVGYCLEEVKDGYYTGGSLDFTTFVIREEGVPVPNNFTDLDNVTLITNVDTILALTSMDATWTTKNAVNYGLGHYVLKTNGKDYEAFKAYLTALKEQGFEPYVALDETVTDGVYSVIYTKEQGEWVLNILYTENENDGEVTLTISSGLSSLSADLKPEANVTEGTVTMSMVKLTGSGDAETYYYGNSFVFKLPNGHFVINDGGNLGDFEGLISQLKTMAGIEENDTTTKIYIDAWTVTHQHADHFSVIKGFRTSEDASALREQVRVEKFYINEPNRKAMLAYSESDVMGEIKGQYRAMRMMKDADGNASKVYWCQTGQTYYFDGLTMDIVQSQEQIPVDSYGKVKANGADGSDYNTCSSSMLFTTANGKKVLITGDMNYVNMKEIKNIYGTASTLLSDINIYQAPHHGKNTSMNIGVSTIAADNSFTDYLAEKTDNGTFDIALFPCSLIYGEGYTDTTTFPQAQSANEHLISKTAPNSSYHYGDGTKTFVLGDTISLQ